MNCQTVSSLFVIICFLGFFQTGTCFQCYSCAGAKGQGDKIPEIDGLPPGITKFTEACADPVKTKELDSAKADCISPMKCTKINVEAKGISVVIRGCQPTEICKIFNTCTQCEDNLCNSSSAFGPSLLLISIVGLIVARYQL